MWQLADDILDDFLRSGEGEFITDFAQPFTLRVIADLLGVPEEDRPELLDRLALGTHGTDGIMVLEGGSRADYRRSRGIPDSGDGESKRSLMASRGESVEPADVGRG